MQISLRISNEVLNLDVLATQLLLVCCIAYITKTVFAPARTPLVQRTCLIALLGLAIYDVPAVAGMLNVAPELVWLSLAAASVLGIKLSLEFS
ncbi:uncharacterized protein L3040_006880 [Drepanopeziza brunnea f. sp. 'multigermtubi']|uniref:uncharacterized protein n=1 Tax=Drepanopeziza brunnea f. sp. 'multigermtubi' TaxID=698441 RepID=UPI002383A05D|nr:hypothetical protein L3040_006880 [Drepanopeziza brunnea f. sp. 'multigermtubi']